MAHTLRLGVNVDHVATLRQARGTTYPSPVEAARLCADAGAHGVTVHLREDRRHIQDADVRTLCDIRVLPVNLEMAIHPDIVAFALEVRPDEVCIVPEKREELTTEGGLDVVRKKEALMGPVSRLGQAGISVSLFIEADEKQVAAAAATGAHDVELHTGTFCDAPPDRRSAELDKLVSGANVAHALGLKVNAGHGINMDTISDLLAVPHMDTLNIGHSIVARSVFLGMEAAVKELLTAMSGYTGGREPS